MNYLRCPSPGPAQHPESERKYATLFQKMTEGFVILDAIRNDAGQPVDLRYVEVNDAFEHQTGVKGANVLGRTLLESFPAVDPKWVTRLAEADVKGGSTQFEEWFGPLDRCFSIAAFQIRSGTLGVVFTNITARKQAEAQLRESEERYRTLFDSLIEGFCIIEMIFDAQQRAVDYRFLETNPAFQAQTGWSDVRGKLVRELAPNHEEYWFEFYRRVALTGESAHMRNQAHELGRWYDVTAFRVGEVELRRVAVLFTDITDRKNAESAREEYIRQLAAERESLSQSERRERARSDELEAIMEVAPAAIFIGHDRECRYISGNRMTRDLLRHPVGSNVSKTAPEGQQPTNFRVMRGGTEIAPEDLPVQYAAFTGRPVWNSEFDLLFDDGSVVNMMGNAVPLLDEDGESRGSVGSFVDISELKRTEQALRDSEERMRLAQEAADIGHFDWNLRTGYTTWSDSLKRFMGDRLDPTTSLVERLVFVHPEDRSAFRSQLEDAQSAQSLKISMTYRSTAGGALSWRICEARVHLDENGKPARIIGVIADITPHKKAEEAQRVENEHKRLEAIIRSLTDGVIIVDSKGQVLSMNLAALQMHQFGPADQTPRDLVEFASALEATHLDGSAVGLHQWPVSRVLNGELVAGVELRVNNRKTGATWIASYGGSPIWANGAVQMAVIGIRDITTERASIDEINRVNAALHKLSGLLLRLQDEERKRIARDLHDGTLQVVTALSLNLLMIARSPSVVGDPETCALIVEGQELAKRASREMRNLSYLLHPPELDELGLVPALRSWANGFAHRTGIALELELEEVGRLDQDTETALFRITQESLANVQRHSGSERAQLRLYLEQDTIKLVVRDFGRGISASILTRASEGIGVGILGMRERARQLGGTLQIEGHESGTVVRAALPLVIA